MPREIKNILVALVPQERGQEQPTAATRMSLALARQSGSFLTINFLSPRPAWVPYSLFTDIPAQLVAQENERFDQSAEACLNLAGEAAAAAGVAFETELIALDFIAMMHRSTRRAQLQDLVLMDAQSGALRDYREIMQGMLFRSGRPVVLVPTRWNADVPRNIVIAWDGSVPAARAVGESLPLLQKADKVCVVTVQGEKDLANTAPSDRLVVYLERHGIQATQECLTAKNRAVASTLTDHVVRSGAEMIVMGAYAHSRLQEAVLGGVTRALLDDSPVPLFMAH